MDHEAQALARYRQAWNKAEEGPGDTEEERLRFIENGREAVKAKRAYEEISGKSHDEAVRAKNR